MIDLKENCVFRLVIILNRDTSDLDFHGTLFLFRICICLSLVTLLTFIYLLEIQRGKVWVKGFSVKFKLYASKDFLFWRLPVLFHGIFKPNMMLGLYKTQEKGVGDRSVDIHILHWIILLWYSSSIQWLFLTRLYINFTRMATLDSVVVSTY